MLCLKIPDEDDVVFDEIEQKEIRKEEDDFDEERREEEESATRVRCLREGVC